MPTKHDLCALSHPYGGLTANVTASQDCHAELIDRGLSVISLINLSTGAEAVRSEREWLLLCLRVIRRCDCLIMGPGWYQSRGCRREYRWARLLGKPIFALERGRLRPLAWSRTWARLPSGWRLVPREVHDGDDLALLTGLGELVTIGPGSIDAETSLSIDAARQCIQLAYGVGILGSESIYEAVRRGEMGL